MHKSNSADRNSPAISLLTSACLAGVLCLGCSSTGYRKSDTAAASMQSAAAQVQAESRAIDATLGSLKDLMNEPNGDLRKPYQHFSSNLSFLEATARRTDNTGKVMAQRSAEYFQIWDKEIAEIDYEHIRELSQARRAEAQKNFENVQHRYQESQEVVGPVITYLQDIHKALGSDLTTSGLGSMKNVVKNAETNSAKVQIALKALFDELSDSGSKFSTRIIQTNQTVQ